MNESDVSVQRGGNSATITVNWGQGNPEIADFDLSNISAFYYSDSAGTDSILATDSDYSIGDETLETIISLENFVDNGDGTGSVDIEVDPSGITESELSMARDVYVRLGVNQPPSRLSDVIHVEITIPPSGDAPMLNDQTISRQVDSSFSITLAATGDGTITYAVQSGSSLPSGVTLNSSTGVLSGSISAANTYTTTIVASSEFGSDTAVITFSITEESPGTPASISGASGSGTVGISFTVQMPVSGTEPLSLSVILGALPPGMELANDGSISGTPTTAGSYSGTVRASNALGSADASFSINVYAVPTVSTPPDVIVNVTSIYGTDFESGTISWSGGSLTFSGTPPSGLTFSVDSGSLTTGGTGQLSGTIPLSADALTYEVTFSCTNPAGHQVSSVYSITVTHNE